MESNRRNNPPARHNPAGKRNAKTPNIQEQYPAEELFVKLVIAQSMPVLFVDGTASMRFFSSLNPAYSRLTCADVKKSAMKYYAREKKSLMSNLRDLNCRVSLTSSLWSDSELERVTYLYLSCQWIDRQWVKQSRVLGFLKLESECGWEPESEVVSSAIMRIVTDWKLEEGKILSITFDDRSYNKFNDGSLGLLQLQSSLSSNGEELLRGKCVYQIIDSCFEHGFSAISSIVEKVRDVIGVIDYRGSKKVKRMCREEGLEYKRLIMDMPLLKNTTYDMLASFVRYRSVLVEFCSLASNGVDDPLSEDEWSVLSKLMSFFETFKSGFDIFCNVYIPTANLVVPVLLTLSEAFAQYRDDETLVGEICSGMESEFAAYWDGAGIPMVYCLATVLDPRYKLDGLFKLLDAYHANMKIPVQDRKSEIKIRFVRFYEAYDAYFQQYRSQTVRAKHLALQSEGCSSFGTGTKSAVRIALIARTSDTSNAEAGRTALHAELNYYLSSDDVSRFDNNIEGGLEMLDVLEWWKSIGIGRYPVLATMARDLLAPVASGKVPEGTFRFYAPGINEMRREFEARIAEMVVCYKDWIVAEERKQHLFVNECEDEDDD